MKKIITYLMICMSAFCLSGCASYPNLSDEDMDLVAEYAAGMLLDYSENSEKRLMDLQEAQAELNQQDEETKLPEDSIEDVKETIPEQMPEGEEVDTPVIDNTEQEELPAPPMNELLGYTDITIKCEGYEIMKSYPNDIDVSFSVDAKEGESLLVAKYVISNIGTEDVEINMLNENISYKISLDGKRYQPIVSSLLMEDLSTYVGTISAGTTVEVVLLSEWSDEAISNCTNLMLSIESGGNEGYYQIQ